MCECVSVRTDGRAKAAGRVAWLAGGCVVEVWRGKKNTSDERIFGEEGGRRKEEGGRRREGEIQKFFIMNQVTLL